MLPAADVGDTEFSIIVSVSRVAEAGFISDVLPLADVSLTPENNNKAGACSLVSGSR